MPARARVRALQWPPKPPPRPLGPWQVLEEADTDGDGLLNFEEFSHAVAHSDIRAKLTIVF